MKNLLSLLPGVRKHRFLGLAVATVLAVLGAALVWIMPSKYEASARAYVDTQSVLGPLLEGMAVQPNVEQQFVMMSRALLSRPNLEEVAEGAGLFKTVTHEVDRRDVVEQLGKDVKFEPEGRGDFFSLKYRNKESEVALTVVSSLLDLFVRATRGDQRRDTEQATEFLDEQLKVYEEKLQAAERKLKDFKVTNLDVLPETGDYLAKSQDTQREYELARLQYRQALNSARAIRRQLDGVPRTVPAPKLPGSNRVVAPATPSQVRLAAARKKFDELSSRYTPQHPDMVSISQVIQSLEQEIRQERLRMPKPVSASADENSRVQNKLYVDLSLALSSAEAEVAALGARVADARRRATETKSLAKKVPKVEAEFAQLTRDYEVNKLNYEKLLARREAASLSGTLEQTSGGSSFRLVDPPSVGKGPVWPNRPLFLVLVLIAAIGAGLFVAAARHLLTPTYFSVAGLRGSTGLPVVGEIGLERGVAGKLRKGMSGGLFWLLCLLLLLAFVGMILWALYGHLVTPADVPEWLAPYLPELALPVDPASPATTAK